LFQKRLEKGQFLMATAEGGVSRDLTSYQLQGLIQGIDWTKIPEPHPLSYKFI
jgi:hypothetical protein